MKRTALLILTLIYAVSCLGISTERFYCCGKLARTTFSLGDSGSSENNKHKTNNCCKTTKESFKVKDQHVGSKTFDLQTKTFVALQPVFYEFRPMAPYVRSAAIYQANAPPERQQTPIYVLHCNYRI